MTIEIIDNYEMPKQYWAVGSSFGSTEDQTTLFLNNDQWVDGYGLSGDSRNKQKLDEVQIDDILVMKSSATKGSGHSITFTKVKAIGIVTGKTNYYTFNVNWLDTNVFPIDFDGIRYGRTIELIRNDDLMSFVQNLFEKNS